MEDFEINIFPSPSLPVPKYSEISTHCGRKTFICLMLSIDIAEKAKTDAMEKALKMSTFVKPDAVKKSLVSTFEKTS